MVLAQRLEGRQTQAPIMTAQMQASIRFLQLANYDLEAALEQYVHANPLLELETPSVPEVPISAGITSPGQTRTQPPSLDWIPEKKSSLYSTIQKQIDQTFHDPKDRFLANQLNHLIDESGYFRYNLKDLSRQWLVAHSHVTNILEALKKMEPVGIFSANLKECLTIQLKDLGVFTPLHARLLPHLNDLFGKNNHKVRQRINVDDKTLAQFIADIRRCCPKPALQWGEQEHNIVKAPDVLVFKTVQGELKIQLNTETLPRLLVNQEYVATLTEKLNITLDKQTTQYFRTKISEAHWLQRSLNQRAETILKVTHAILSHQKKFLTHGVCGLRPLCLKDISQVVKIHESTVSRAISGKTAETPRGIVELKAFFTSGVGNYHQELTSAVAIQQSLKDLIAKENPQTPYSDAGLIDLLAVKGIRVARRTIAKYRKILNIPTSYDRRHQKNRGF